MRSPHHTGHRPGPRDQLHHDPFEPSGDGAAHRGRGPGSRGRGGRGRVPRGDVRSAVLLLLAEEPMHGYQLMQAIAERSGGRWTPSPGAIYPAIDLLEDEALVTVTAESGRKVVALTDSGREPWRPSAPPGRTRSSSRPTDRPDRTCAVWSTALHDATRQVGRTGTQDQVVPPRRSCPTLGARCTCCSPTDRGRR